MRLRIAIQTDALLALHALVIYDFNVFIVKVLLFKFIIDILALGCRAIHDVLILGHLPPEAELQNLFDHLRVRGIKLISNKPVRQLSFAFKLGALDRESVSIHVALYGLAHALLVIRVAALRHRRSEVITDHFEADSALNSLNRNYLLLFLFRF